MQILLSAGGAEIFLSGAESSPWGISHYNYKDNFGVWPLCPQWELFSPGAETYYLNSNKSLLRGGICPPPLIWFTIGIYPLCLSSGLAFVWMDVLHVLKEMEILKLDLFELHLDYENPLYKTYPPTCLLCHFHPFKWSKIISFK